VAVELLPELKKAAKERQRVHGGTSPGKAANTGGNNAISDSGKARDQAAKLVGVSPRYVSDAAKLKDESPTTFQDVKNGIKTIPEGARQVRKERQIVKGNCNKLTALVRGFFADRLTGSKSVR